ncbi:MAG: hypothetical protein NUV74_12655 [Candidatus Brocadiaceae bacterium]|nr:hypothetical protein [Candidatus Brocadiaceae bacterium]
MKGKVSSASLLKGMLHVTEFVNADLIALGLSAFKPEIAYSNQEQKLVVTDSIIWHNIVKEYGSKRET